jgi:hypothetical protein
VRREEGGHYTVSKRISDISDQRSGNGKTIMAKGSGITIRRKEEFIEEKECDGKKYVTPQTPFGMTELGQARKKNASLRSE